MESDAQMPAPMENSAALTPLGEARLSLDQIAGLDFTHFETGVSPLASRAHGYARALSEACQRKTAGNLGLAFTPGLDLTCASCLYMTTMPGIYLYPDRRCNMCHAFERGLKQAQAEGRLAAELTEALESRPTGDAPCDVIVALSGGKDSSAILSYASLERGLRCTAVLVDNGFIPDHVVQNCQAMCDRVGAEFVKLDFDFRPQIRALMKATHIDIVPCNLCSKRFKRLITDFAAEQACSRVLMGRNTWAAIEPELTGKRRMTAGAETAVNWFSVPFLLRWTIDDLWSRLEAIGWNSRNMTIPGNSTNCLVPGMIAGKYEAAVGVNPDTQLVADEVIVGFISREEGLRQLTQED